MFLKDLTLAASEQPNTDEVPVCVHYRGNDRDIPEAMRRRGRSSVDTLAVRDGRRALQCVFSSVH